MVTPTAQTSITVSWDTDTAVATYKLERAIAVTPTATPAWTQVAVVTPAPSSTTTSYPDSGRSCGTNYLYRVSAIGDGTDYSKFEYGDPSQPKTASTDHYCTPQDLTIIPMPQRKAELRWGAVTNRINYVVQIRKVTGPGTPTPTPASLPAQTSTTYGIDLDNILSNEGLAHVSAFQFQVQANLPGNITFTSAPIILADSPILSVNGHSPGTGQAVVKWIKPDDALEYVLRWRQLGPDANGDTHTDVYWKLDDTSHPPNFADDDKKEITDASKTSSTIESLNRYGLYAIQMNYRTASGWVFSARDAYVWPSDRAADGGERVATFPLNYPLRNAQGVVNKTYAYYTCLGTFQGTGKSDDWKNIIIHAFGQWQLATDGLVTMSHLGSDCAEYEDIIKMTKDEIDKLKYPVPISVIRNLIVNLDDYANFTKEDSKKNEVIMVDDVAGNVKDLMDVGVFPELAQAVGFHDCAFTGPACAVPSFTILIGLNPAIVTTTDILLRRSSFENDALNIPGGDQSVDRSDAPFNACGAPRDGAYETLIHEAGHALGIRGGTDGAGQLAEHPTLAGSVMSYERQLMLPNDPDCSPHPLDIMAIYALYQTIP